MVEVLPKAQDGRGAHGQRKARKRLLIWQRHQAFRSALYGVLLTVLGGCASLEREPVSVQPNRVAVSGNNHIRTSSQGQAKIADELVTAVSRDLLQETEPLVSEQLIVDRSLLDEGPLANIGNDYRHYYTGSDFRFACMALGTAAAFAHTDVDEGFREWWQQDVRSNAWDDFSHFAKPLGDGYISIAIISAGAAVGWLADESAWGSATGEWGRRSLRALAVGAPPLLFVQAATGAARPGETSAESDWVPFQDTNGASGHTFMGAVPFLVAADMTDSVLLSGLCYTGSLMCGVSRINDDDHYLSQVILGWCLAKMATDAVAKTQEAKSYEVVPLNGAGGVTGIGLEFRR